MADDLEEILDENDYLFEEEYNVCQWVVVEFYKEPNTEKYGTVVSMCVSKKNVVVVDCRDSDSDIESLISRVSNRIYLLFTHIIPFSVVHEPNKEPREIDLLQYLTEETKITIGEFANGDFDLNEYVKNNDVILLEHAEGIH